MLEDVRVDVREQRGDFDLAIAVVDPAADGRRSLVLRLSPNEETHGPLEAQRSGEDRTPRFNGRPVPRLTPPYSVSLGLRPQEGKTRWTVRIVRDTQELYSAECELVGEDWASGAVLLWTASSTQGSFDVALSRWTLSGFPIGRRLEEIPWHD